MDYFNVQTAEEAFHNETKNPVDPGLNILSIPITPYTPSLNA